MEHKWLSGRAAGEIARSIEAAIRAGRIRPGELLPTVRELATTLHVSPATAGAAYHLLRGRGLLTADRRRGTRVLPSAHPHAGILVRDERVGRAVDLSSGNPDGRLLPSLTAALRFVPDQPSLYDDRADLPALSAFAKAEFSADRITVHDVGVTSGALDAIDRVLREHVRPGDRVGVEDPCFPALRDLLAVSGLTALPIAIDPQGVVPEALDEALKHRPSAVILTPRGHNPSGAACGAARAADLKAVFTRYPSPLLIENDPLGPVAGVPALTLTGGRALWAIVRSTSKFLGPDLRVALLAGDETTMARVRARQAVSARWVSRVLQHLALALWSDPSSGRQLARAADVYTRRRTALIQALADHDLHVHAASGFNVWVPVRYESAVVERLLDRGWAVAPGERFRLRSGPGIRVTTSALEPDAAQRFAADLAQVVHSSVPALA